jgi:hypothetical protein
MFYHRAFHYRAGEVPQRIIGRPYAPRGSISKVELQSELNHPGLISLAADVPEPKHIVSVSIRRPENDSVEDVEELRTELQVHRFPDLGPFADQEVLVVEGEASSVRQNVRRIPEGEGCRRRKSRGIEIHIRRRIKVPAIRHHRIDAQDRVRASVSVE